MSAAELSLWTRRRETRRADVQAALWQRRELVKTTCMRMTLHLVAARDFPTFIAAMKPSSMASVHRLLARIGASPKHVETMVRTVMDALADGPKTQQDLLARARLKAERGMRVWLKYAWSAMRPAILEGLICYGPPRGPAAIDAAGARAEMAARFLTAFGPATPRDFSKWSGLKSGDAQAAFDALGGDLVQVTVAGAPCRMLRRDLDALADSALDTAPRLLPAFDTYLLAHAAKDHLVEPRFYKRVYRNQGWLSPVVLVSGRIVAVWFLEQRARSYTVDVRPFDRLDKRVQSGIKDEAHALGLFLGAPCDVAFAEPS
jgi:hypothetical protein